MNDPSCGGRAGSTGSRVVRVVPEVPALGRGFDYLVPAKWEDGVGVGARVRVNLHGRRVGGWVVEDHAEPPPGIDLQPLTGFSGHGPPPAVIDLAMWAAWRWAGPVSALLRAASPTRVVAQLPPTPDRDAPALARAADEASVPSAGSSLTDGPDATGWLAAAVERAVETAVPGDGRPTLLRVPPANDLLPVVLAALPAVAASPEAGSLLVLVPSAGWAERLAARLRRRGVPVAASWQEAAAGWPVVVGARAAAWSPLPRVVAAVVLDVHDEAYRETRMPTFDAAEVVAERARRGGAPCIWVSPCPTAVHVSRSVVQEPPPSVEGAGWPSITVVDRRAADPRTGLFSEEFVRAARRVLDTSAAVVCVLNRTGRAKLLACAHCGEIPRCERCGRAVVQDRDQEWLRCPTCGSERPFVCAVCGSARLKVLRPGVSRVRDELEALLGVPVADVSGREGAARDGAREDAAERDAPVIGRGSQTGPVSQVNPASEAAQVLAGTEAVLHRVRRAGLVAFLDFDQHLLAPRFTAEEESIALLARGGRLVGGRRDDRRQPQAPGLLVQTRVPDHAVLRAAVRGEAGPLAAGELEVRESLNLPPFSALALVSGPGAVHLVGSLKEAGRVAVSQLTDGRWLVRAAEHSLLSDELLAARRLGEPVRVEIDPVRF